MSSVPNKATQGDESLQLKSDDGVVFEVKRYHLMSASVVFRDMLALPATQADTPIPCAPIEIDAHSKIVGLFISLVEQGPLPPSHAISRLFPSGHDLFGGVGAVQILAILLEVLDRFDCSTPIRERVLNHFEPLFHYDPWTVFCLAARQADTSTAKRAIQSMSRIRPSERQSVDFRFMSLADAKRVPLDWLLAYCRAGIAVSSYYAVVDPTKQDYWNKVADCLDVPTE